MHRGRGVITFITGVAVSTALLGLLVVPDLSVSVPTDVGGVASVSVTIGETALAGGAVAAGTLVWVAATGAMIERLGTAWTRLGTATGRAIGFVYPTSPMWRFAVIVMLMIGLVLIVIGTIPSGIAAGP